MTKRPLEATFVAMKTVGIRELKNRLSEYIRIARSHGPILITSRGEVVAELRPPDCAPTRSGLPAAVLELAARGALRPGGGNDPTLYPVHAPLVSAGTSAKLIDEDRGER